MAPEKPGWDLLLHILNARTFSLKDNLEKRSSAWPCAQDSFSPLKLFQLQGVDLNPFRTEVEIYLVTERFLGARSVRETNPMQPGSFC